MRFAFKSLAPRSAVRQTSKRRSDRSSKTTSPLKAPSLSTPQCMASGNGTQYAWANALNRVIRTPALNVLEILVTPMYLLEVE